MFQSWVKKKKGGKWAQKKGAHFFLLKKMGDPKKKKLGKKWAMKFA